MTTNTLTLLGFDFGTHSIGVAIGQTVTGTAKPLTAVRAKNSVPCWEKIADLIQTWQPNILVVGLPTNVDGSEY